MKQPGSEEKETASLVIPSQKVKVDLQSFPCAYFYEILFHQTYVSPIHNNSKQGHALAEPGAWPIAPNFCSQATRKS